MGKTYSSAQILSFSEFIGFLFLFADSQVWPLKVKIDWNGKQKKNIFH